MTRPEGGNPAPIEATEPATGGLEAGIPLTVCAPGADGTRVRIGPYELVEELGSGGMGIVYLARRADGQYERLVALKVARATLTDPRVRDWLVAEREILAGFSHPNIATLYDGGVTGEGHPYFTMEYVDGQPIDAWCDSRALDVRARLGLFLDVCHAVTAAHRHLVVHSDLKPRNVLVDREGRVKLLDFGIARLLADDSRRENGASGGFRLMTPDYASPEQFTGGRVSTATDVYALGLLLFELLSGRRAHRIQTRDLGEIRDVVLSQEPLRPSEAVGAAPDDALAAETIAARRGTTPARLKRTLRGDLDRIVSMALRKQPEQRYASVSLLAEDIDRFLSCRPVRARGEAPGYRARKFMRRHRTVVAAAALILALVIGTSVMAVHHAAEMRRAADLARLESARATAAVDSLVGLFETSDPDVAQGTGVTDRELLERGLLRAKQLSAQPALQAELLHTIGRVYFSMGRYDRAREILEHALEVGRATFGDRHANVSRGYRQLGKALRESGRLESAEEALRRALEIDRALGGPTSADVAADQHELGYTLLQRGQLDEGERLVRLGLALRRARFGDNHVEVAESLSGAAYARAAQGHPRNAADLYRQALAVRVRTLGDRHPEVARAHQNLAVILSKLDQTAEAEEHLVKALEVYRSVYGDAHPSIAVTLNNLAILASDKGDHEKAEPLFRESVEMRRALLGDEHPSTRRAMSNLAAVLVRRNRLAESLHLFQRMLEVERRAPTAGGALLRGNYAEALRRLGRLDEAERLSREGLALSRRAGSRTLTEASILAVLGRTLEGRRANVEAAEMLTLSLEIRRERLGDDHPDVARTRGYLEKLPKPMRVAR